MDNTASAAGKKGIDGAVKTAKADRMSSPDTLIMTEKRYRYFQRFLQDMPKRVDFPSRQTFRAAFRQHAKTINREFRK